MHKTNCMQVFKIFQCGKYLVAYVLKGSKISLRKLVALLLKVENLREDGTYFNACHMYTKA